MTEYASREHVPGDHNLRRDIRLLGWKFRRLLQLHGEGDVWDVLDRLRDLAERRRRGDDEAESTIAAALTELPVERLTLLARAMGVFFDLANLAEDRHRARVLRTREAAGRQSETIQQAIDELRQSTEPDELRSILRRMRVEPVFTAHPTEAKRRSVRRVLRRLRRDLYSLDDTSMLRSERQQFLDRMSRDLFSLWLTDPILPRKASKALE